MAPKIQWPLVLFSMLAGCGGCAFAFAGIANAMGESTSVTLFVTVVAFVLVVVGAICSMMHLATPKHAFAAVTHLLSFSGISVELIMLGVVCALMILFAGSVVFIDNATATLVLGLLGALSGVALAFVTGHGYLISSKPTWNTKKLPLAYTGTAAVAGGFLYVAIAAFAGADPAIVRALCWILLGCVAFSAVFSVACPVALIDPTLPAYRDRHTGDIIAELAFLNAVGKADRFSFVYSKSPRAAFVVVCVNPQR